MLAQEIHTMKKMEEIVDHNKQKLKAASLSELGIPQIVDYGMLLLQNFNAGDDKEDVKMCGYYIIPQYQHNLNQYLEIVKKDLIDGEIFGVAKQLMGIFKIVHTAHRTFNDLKPENIMINIQDDGTAKVFLIDFGFAAKYVKDKTGDHIEVNDGTDMFQGNLLFSTVSQMKFLKTSRRDDIISLFYMIVYLLNDS